ncbi:putative uncharacterized protein ENSP00000383309 [Gigantopelta aegis]|uniref:putative uncharacterized protein ENSP00000383309 n=1 Tax=Gigantopelta aegis TaxID=1735272 RepID=UPI001B88E617|nr:putative uncharacterized protein ENSP00000383309 [Gigantopelta aegis]
MKSLANSSQKTTSWHCYQRPPCPPIPSLTSCRPTPSLTSCRPTPSLTSCRPTPSMTSCRPTPSLTSCRRTEVLCRHRPSAPSENSRKIAKWARRRGSNLVRPRIKRSFYTGLRLPHNKAHS